MLDEIDKIPALWQITRRSCEENNIGIDICDGLIVAGELREDLIRILKVDDYYCTQNFATPPKSIDCLIVVKCDTNSYELTLVELRNVSSIQGIKPRDILEKFRSTFVRFMGKDFPEIFNNPAYGISSIRAWLVSDPFNLPNLSDDVYRRKIGSTRLDAIQSARPLVFGNFKVVIEHKRPSPNRPEVCVC